MGYTQMRRNRTRPTPRTSTPNAVFGVEAGAAMEPGLATRCPKCRNTVGTCTCHTNLQGWDKRTKENVDEKQTGKKDEVEGLFALRKLGAPIGPGGHPDTYDLSHSAARLSPHKHLTEEGYKYTGSTHGPKGLRHHYVHPTKGWATVPHGPGDVERGPHGGSAFKDEVEGLFKDVLPGQTDKIDQIMARFAFHSEHPEGSPEWHAGKSDFHQKWGYRHEEMASHYVKGSPAWKMHQGLADHHATKATEHLEHMQDAYDKQGVNAHGAKFAANEVPKGMDAGHHNALVRRGFVYAGKSKTTVDPEHSSGNAFHKYVHRKHGTVVEHEEGLSHFYKPVSGSGTTTHVHTGASNAVGDLIDQIHRAHGGKK